MRGFPAWKFFHEKFIRSIIAELPPGNYTAIVRGVNNTTGVALVEVYDLQ